MPKCPRDATELQIVTKGECEDHLASCATCGGAWLESKDIAALCPTAAHLWAHREEVALQRLIQQPEPTGGIKGAIGACLSCAKRTTEIVLAGMPIDFCTHCGGLWLDGPEALAFVREPKAEVRRSADPFRQSATQLAQDGKLKCIACETRDVPKRMLARADGFYCVRCFYAAQPEAPEAAMGDIVIDDVDWHPGGALINRITLSVLSALGRLSPHG